MTSEKEPQIAPAVMMIRPARFQTNPLTASSNRFQGKTDAPPAEQHQTALAEFEALKTALEQAGVQVFAFDDTREPHTPDAIFPNNWVSFHADGTVVLYPMEAENRRTERRRDIVEALASEHGFHVRRVIDLSAHEQNGHFLEGTGSMVLDRVHRVAYACISSRTHLEALGDFAQQLDYDVVAFDALDAGGVPIYHTNVVMNVGERIAVICAEAIPSEAQRKAVLQRLADTGHELVTLSFRQLTAFAGNMLELRTANGQRVTAMSDVARRSLEPEQLKTLENNGTLIAVPIDNIECSAGGSVRCMLAEIHLPRKGERA